MDLQDQGEANETFHFAIRPELATQGSGIQNSRIFGLAKSIDPRQNPRYVTIYMAFFCLPMAFFSISMISCVCVYQ